MTRDFAQLSHGRDGWTLYVEEVSLWRVVVSEWFMHIMHVTGFCCGDKLFAWNRWLPDWLANPYWRISFSLLNWAGRIDNGWHHVRYTMPVNDDFAREHFPDFWADVQSWAEEDI